jgi:DNA repair protein RadC
VPHQCPTAPPNAAQHIDIYGVVNTHDIINIAQPFGIVVHDHLIVGRNGHSSLKGLKMI